MSTKWCAHDTDTRETARGAYDAAEIVVVEVGHTAEGSQIALLQIQPLTAR